MRKTWLPSEEKKLIDNYSSMTIKELQGLLSRSKDSINKKIKTLKKKGKITTPKEDETIKRAYRQRGK